MRHLFFNLSACADLRTVSFNAFFPNDSATNAHIDVQADHYKIVREIGAAGAVLLKNTNSALPLKKPRSVALIGTLCPTSTDSDFC